MGRTRGVGTEGRGGTGTGTGAVGGSRPLGADWELKGVVGAKTRRDQDPVCCVCVCCRAEGEEHTDIKMTHKNINTWAGYHL